MDRAAKPEYLKPGRKTPRPAEAELVCEDGTVYARIDAVNAAVEELLGLDAAPVCARWP